MFLRVFIAIIVAVSLVFSFASSSQARSIGGKHQAEARGKAAAEKPAKPKLKTFKGKAAGAKTGKHGIAKGRTIQGKPGKAPVRSKTEGKAAVRAGRNISFASSAGIHLGPKEVALTFDDGPVPGNTGKILATLSQHGVKATFLMVGRMARAYPAMVRRVVQAGHAIGSHSYSHPNLAGLSYEAAVEEMRRGHAAVRRAAGTNVPYFRFPYLASTAGLRQWAARSGMAVLGIHIDSKDYLGGSPAAIASRTMAAVRQKGRGIILMHDIHSRTAAMLPALLTQLKAEGYRVVPLRRGAAPALVAALN